MFNAKYSSVSALLCTQIKQSANCHSKVVNRGLEGEGGPCSFALFDLKLFCVPFPIHAIRSDRKLWTGLLFIATSLTFAGRTIMPLVAVKVGDEFGWNKEQSV